jgi:hypothetical protein
MEAKSWYRSFGQLLNHGNPQNAVVRKMLAEIGQELGKQTLE